MILKLCLEFLFNIVFFFCVSLIVRSDFLGIKLFVIGKGTYLLSKKVRMILDRIGLRFRFGTLLKFFLLGVKVDSIGKRASKGSGREINVYYLLGYGFILSRFFKNSFEVGLGFVVRMRFFFYFWIGRSREGLGV